MPEEEDDDDEPEAHPGGSRTGAASRHPQTGEDKDDEVGLLGVSPGFAPRDGHAQPPVVQVWIWSFFELRLGTCTVALDFGVFFG